MNTKEPYKLPERPEKLPFDVPDGYFDTFLSKVQGKIEARQPESIMDRLVYYIRPQLGLLSLMAGFFIVSLIAIKTLNIETNQITQAQENLLTSAEIEQYLSEHVHDIDEHMLLEMMAGQPSEEGQDNLFEDASEDEIINLLMEEGITIDDMMMNEL